MEKVERRTGPELRAILEVIMYLEFHREAALLLSKSWSHQVCGFEGRYEVGCIMSWRGVVVVEVS
jgi:hypothetical protein